MANPPILIPLGGFLGAGKTTLILTAARYLQGKGVKVAAILNDQGSDLVDTEMAARSGVDADQVTGGCFCCRFSALIDAVDRLRAHAPAIIFAEAVGSCTDISATTLQPLKVHFSDLVRLAPFSVLVDPERAREVQAGDGGSDLAFLFNKQIEEADLLCFTKADLYSDFPELPGVPVRYLSSLTGQGVSAWLDEILAGEIEPGGRILNIDYARYARAEAALAWLNCRVSATLSAAFSPSSLLGPLLDRLDEALTSAGMRIAHLKLMDNSPSGYLKASITANRAEPGIEGMLDASPASAHELLLNVRATGSPEILQRVVELELAKIPGYLAIKTMQCFSPAAPNPERRHA